MFIYAKNIIVLEWGNNFLQYFKIVPAECILILQLILNLLKTFPNQPFYESPLCGTKMGNAADRNANDVEEGYSISSASQFVLMPQESYGRRR